MGKLVFIYGPMGSAKTANALMQYFELKQQNKNVILLKPSIADRDGKTIIKSRIGLESEALAFSGKDDLLGLGRVKGLEVIIVDEAQFCNEQQITNLKNLTIDKDIKVYCYGLKSDFTTHLFEGSKRLFELADEFRQLEMTCANCGKPSEVNARVDKNNSIIKEGDPNNAACIKDRYKSLCYSCWRKLDKIC